MYQNLNYEQKDKVDKKIEKLVMVTLIVVIFTIFSLNAKMTHSENDNKNITTEEYIIENTNKLSNVTFNNDKKDVNAVKVHFDENYIKIGFSFNEGMNKYFSFFIFTLSFIVVVGFISAIIETLRDKMAEKYFT